MRHSIVHAITACLTALLTLILPASGQHRRRCAELTPTVPTWPEMMSLVTEDTPPPRDVPTGPDPATDPDIYPVVPWYIVLADSAHWRNDALARQRAVQLRQAQAILDGDGMETCWDGCPCQRLPAPVG